MLLPLAVAVSALLGALLVGSTMRPLKRLIDSAQRLAPDLSGARLPVTGKDEFAELAGTFNAVFDRTSEAFQKQRQAISQLERFTADAGHELRTPLGAIKSGSTYLLHISKLPDDCKKPAQIMDRSADRMAKLIDDLLLLARQEGGQSMEIRPDIEVSSLIDEAREEVAEPEYVSVTISVDRSLKVRGDRDALRRVLLNLISNAFAFARSEVKITARRDGKGVVVSVSDDGEGIAPEHIGRLGERFYRPDSSRSRHKGGTGLGLAIAKSICMAHGGALEIESTPGFGTTVRALIAD